MKIVPLLERRVTNFVITLKHFSRDSLHRKRETLPKSYKNSSLSSCFQPSFSSGSIWFDSRSRQFFLQSLSLQSIYFHQPLSTSFLKVKDRKCSSETKECEETGTKKAVCSEQEEENAYGFSTEILSTDYTSCDAGRKHSELIELLFHISFSRQTKSVIKKKDRRNWVQERQEIQWAWKRTKDKKSKQEKEENHERKCRIKMWDEVLLRLALSTTRVTEEVII